jgi:hypothetical protein
MSGDQINFGIRKGTIYRVLYIIFWVPRVGLESGSFGRWKIIVLPPVFLITIRVAAESFLSIRCTLKFYVPLSRIVSGDSMLDIACSSVSRVHVWVTFNGHNPIENHETSCWRHFANTSPLHNHDSVVVTNVRSRP